MYVNGKAGEGATSPAGEQQQYERASTEGVNTQQDQGSKTGAAILERMMENQAAVASRYQPVMDLDQSIARYEAMSRYIRMALVEGVDYGVVPGIEKPFLWKPGAQKLCIAFGYVPRYRIDIEIEDWTGQRYGEPLFYYRIACTLEKDGHSVGEGIGSCNSWESKYRYRWTKAEDIPLKLADRIGDLASRAGNITEFAFAIEKAETSGPYGKPAAYWQKWAEAVRNGEARATTRTTKGGKVMEAFEMGSTVYRIPNDQFPDIINTCQKQAEKRAYVEATLSATGLSDRFTQDEEGVTDLPSVEVLKRQASAIDTGGHAVGTKEAAQHVAQQKLAKKAPAMEFWGTMGAMCRDFQVIREEIGDSWYLTELATEQWRSTRDIVAAHDRKEPKVKERILELYARLLARKEAA